MYLKQKKNIDKIKKANPNLSQEELINKCSKKGGTSIGLAILLAFVNLIIIFIILLILSFGLVVYSSANFLSKLKDILPQDTKDIHNNIEEQTEFDGTIYYDSDIKIANEYSIVIPSVFNQDEFFNDEYSYNYTYDSENGIFNSCKFNMSKVLGYTASEKLAQELYNYKVKESESVLSTLTINNINWYYFNFEDGFGQNYYYITEKGNSVYLLTYEVQDDAPQDCLIYKDQVLNSIKSLN